MNASVMFDEYFFRNRNVDFTLAKRATICAVAKGCHCHSMTGHDARLAQTRSVAINDELPFGGKNHAGIKRLAKVFLFLLLFAFPAFGGQKLNLASTAPQACHKACKDSIEQSAETSLPGAVVCDKIDQVEKVHVHEDTSIDDVYKLLTEQFKYLNKALNVFFLMGFLVIIGKMANSVGKE